MENIQQTAEMAFHGVTYIIRLNVRENTLFIEIEQKDNGSTWKNTFTSAYLEELTQKTGNYKTFPVFVKMLISSLVKSSSSVFLDILTYHDLEMLRAKKQNTSATTTDRVTNTKRYMILTYSVEYDKVHYPLPLNYESNPDVEGLKSTIKRLRAEIEDLKVAQSVKPKEDEGMFFMTAMDGGIQDLNKNSELTALKAENEALKEKIKKIQENQFNSSASKKLGAVEYDNLIRTKQDLESELKGIKDEHAKDVKWMKVRLEESEAEMNRLREELAKARNEDSLANTQNSSHSRTDPYGGRKLSGNRNQKETERLIREVDTLKANDRKSKAKIRQLELDLEAALKRAAVARTSNNNSLYSRNSPSNNSTGSRKSPAMTPKSYSPAGRSNDRRNAPINTRTPPNRVSPLGKGTPTRNTLGSSMKSYQSGSSIRSRASSQSPANSSAQSIISKGSDRRVSPQRSGKLFGIPAKAPLKNQRSSPANRSPGSNAPSSSLKPGNNTPSTVKLSPGNRFGIRQNNYMSNNTGTRKPLDNAVGNKSRTQNQPSPDNSKRAVEWKGATIGGIARTNAPHQMNAYANFQQRLKENNYGSKGSVDSENKVGKGQESSIEITDINERLDKLQGLLNGAKGDK